jgi:hypothetical protein
MMPSSIILRFLGFQLLRVASAQENPGKFQLHLPNGSPLQPPTRMNLKFLALGSGTQNYICQKDPSGKTTSWAPHGAGLWFFFFFDPPHFRCKSSCANHAHFFFFLFVCVQQKKKRHCMTYQRIVPKRINWWPIWWQVLRTSKPDLTWIHTPSWGSIPLSPKRGNSAPLSKSVRIPSSCRRLSQLRPHLTQSATLIGCNWMPSKEPSPREFTGLPRAAERLCQPLWCQGLVPFSYTRW